MVSIHAAIHSSLISITAIFQGFRTNTSQPKPTGPRTPNTRMGRGPSTPNRRTPQVDQAGLTGSNGTLDLRHCPEFRQRLDLGTDTDSHQNTQTTRTGRPPQLRINQPSQSTKSSGEQPPVHNARSAKTPLANQLVKKRHPILKTTDPSAGTRDQHQITRRLNPDTSTPLQGNNPVHNPTIPRPQINENIVRTDPHRVDQKLGKIPRGGIPGSQANGQNRRIGSPTPSRHDQTRCHLSFQSFQSNQPSGSILIHRRTRNHRLSHRTGVRSLQPPSTHHRLIPITPTTMKSQLTSQRRRRPKSTSPQELNIVHQSGEPTTNRFP